MLGNQDFTILMECLWKETKAKDVIQGGINTGKKSRDKKIKEAGHLYIEAGQNNCLIMPCASSAPPVLRFH